MTNTTYRDLECRANRGISLMCQTCLDFILLQSLNLYLFIDLVLYSSYKVLQNVKYFFLACAPTMELQKGISIKSTGPRLACVAVGDPEKVGMCY